MVFSIHLADSRTPGHFNWIIFILGLHDTQILALRRAENAQIYEV